LQCVTLVLQGQLLRRAKTLDRDSRLCRDRGQAEYVGLAVGFGSIALDGDHPEHPIAGTDRDDEARLRRNKLPRLRPIEKAARGPLGRPPADDLGQSASNDLAREPLTQRERAALVLVAAVHLPDDLDGLTRLFIEREQEN